MGILYIVATPIGNLADLSFRALQILKEVDLIVCEDTRQTLKLINHHNISKPLISYFQHSKLSKIDYIFERLAEGKNIALVTDAGTPGISDPGNKLIEELFLICHSRPLRRSYSEASGSGNPDPGSGFRVKPGMTQGGDLKIVPIPGPNAAIAALSISGFPANKFIFMGFPPAKHGRNKYFYEVISAKYTVVFYESTHRISRTLNDLKLAFIRAQISENSRALVVCRELTKQFESIYRGTAEEILRILESDVNNQKGEFVIIVGK